MVLLVNVDKFDNNFVLVNVNKLKSYNYANKDGKNDNVATGNESINDKDHEEVDVNNVQVGIYCAYVEEELPIVVVVVVSNVVLGKSRVQWKMSSLKLQ